MLRECSGKSALECMLQEGSGIIPEVFWECSGGVLGLCWWYSGGVPSEYV